MPGLRTGGPGPARAGAGTGPGSGEGAPLRHLRVRPAHAAAFRPHARTCRQGWFRRVFRQGVRRGGVRPRVLLRGTGAWSWLRPQAEGGHASRGATDAGVRGKSAPARLRPSIRRRLCRTHAAAGNGAGAGAKRAGRGHGRAHRAHGRRPARSTAGRSRSQGRGDRDRLRPSGPRGDLRAEGARCGDRPGQRLFPGPPRAGAEVRRRRRHRSSAELRPMQAGTSTASWATCLHC